MLLYRHKGKPTWITGNNPFKFITFEKIRYNGNSFEISPLESMFYLLINSSQESKEIYSLIPRRYIVGEVIGSSSRKEPFIISPEEFYFPHDTRYIGVNRSIPVSVFHDLEKAGYRLLKEFDNFCIL